MLIYKNEKMKAIVSSYIPSCCNFFCCNFNFSNSRWRSRSLICAQFAAPACFSRASNINLSFSTSYLDSSASTRAFSSAALIASGAERVVMMSCDTQSKLSLKRCKNSCPSYRDGGCINFYRRAF